MEFLSSKLVGFKGKAVVVQDVHDGLAESWVDNDVNATCKKFQGSLLWLTLPEGARMHAPAQTAIVLPQEPAENGLVVRGADGQDVRRQRSWFDTQVDFIAPGVLAGFEEPLGQEPAPAPGVNADAVTDVRENSGVRMTVARQATAGEPPTVILHTPPPQPGGAHNKQAISVADLWQEITHPQERWISAGALVAARSKASPTELLAIARTWLEGGRHPLFSKAAQLSRALSLHSWRRTRRYTRTSTACAPSWSP